MLPEEPSPWHNGSVHHAKPRETFGADMSEFIGWLTSTPLGLAAVIVGLVVFFTLIALNSERKTRKLYPDTSRRGTKAVAKAKAEKKAKARAAKEARDAEKPEEAEEDKEANEDE
jgi:hypothetical protein